MSDPRERVLEHALGRLLRPDADDAERAASVLRAWERGERGSGLPPEWSQDDAELSASEFAAPARTAPVQPAAARATRLWRPAAAAAALLVGLGLGFWALRGEDARNDVGPSSNELPLLARASEPVEGARDGTHVAPGDVTWVEAGREVRFRFEGGGVLLARGPAALGWRVDDEIVGVDLLEGEVEIERAGLGIELQTDFGRVAAHGSTSFAAALMPDDAQLGWAPQSPRSTRSRSAGVRSERSQLLRLEVRAGSAELASARSIERVTAGTERWLASDPGETASLSRKDEERLAELFASVSDPDLPYATGGAVMEKLFEWREGAWLELHALLAARPDRWAALEPKIRELFAGASLAPLAPGADTEQGWTLDLVARDPSRTSLRLARELWRAAPQAFSLDHVLSFAKRGAFEFERELYAIALSGAEPDPRRREIAACQIALDGDPVVREVLSSAFDALAPEDAEQPTDTALSRRLMIAAALDAIGDSEPLRGERAHRLRACRTWLDSGQTARAQRAALALLFLDRLRAEPSPNLAYAPLFAERFMRAGRWTYFDEDALRALLDELEAAGR